VDGGEWLDPCISRRRRGQRWVAVCPSSARRDTTASSLERRAVPALLLSSRSYIAWKVSRVRDSVCRRRTSPSGSTRTDLSGNATIRQVKLFTPATTVGWDHGANRFTSREGDAPLSPLLVRGEGGRRIVLCFWCHCSGMHEPCFLRQKRQP